MSKIKNKQSSQLKQKFDQLRKRYPSKVSKLSEKVQILTQWIKQQHLLQFKNIFIAQNEVLDRQKQKQKVIDQKEQISQYTNNLQQIIKQCVTNIIETQEKLKTNQQYQSQYVQQIVSKSISIMKDQIIKHKNANNKNKVKSPRFQQIVYNQKKQIQSKTNTLFVKKQNHIPQQNIFKDQHLKDIQNLHQNEQQQKIIEKVTQVTNLQVKQNQTVEKAEFTQQINQKQEEILKEEQQKEEQQKSAIESPIKQNNEQNQIKYQSSINQYNNQQPKYKEKQIVKHKQQKFVPQTKKISLKQPFVPFLPVLKQPSVPHKASRLYSILSNPFIKKAFTHICKQSYVAGGKTFDDISRSSDTMTLNKWMVFCKEFQFNSLLSKKELIDIFQQVSKFKPTIDQQLFLEALIILQTKLKIDEHQFVANKIGLDSQFKLMDKIASFKVSYAGPTIDCFKQASILPLDRHYQKLSQERYKRSKQKQKRYILHQGKFHQQIINELQQRKNTREARRFTQNLSVVESRLNHSILMNNSSIKSKQSINETNKSPYLKFLQNKSSIGNNSIVRSNQSVEVRLKPLRRIEPLTYSDIFDHKNSISTNTFTQKNNNELKKSHQNLIKLTVSSRIHPQVTQEAPKVIQQIKMRPSQAIQPGRIWPQIIKDWSQQYKSDSQQSDEILREHLSNEKKHEVPNQPIQLSRLIEDYKKDQQWLDMKQQDQWERETQLLITKNIQRFK